MARIREIVENRRLYFVEDNETVAGAARRMAELRVGAILVLNGGELKGVFSERDVMLRVVVEGLAPETTRVSRVMSTQLATIDDSATVEEAMEAMQAANCRHLPVLHDGRVCAFLSMRDLMNYELARRTEDLRHMQAYIKGS